MCENERVLNKESDHIPECIQNKGGPGRVRYLEKQTVSEEHCKHTVEECGVTLIQSLCNINIFRIVHRVWCGFIWMCASGKSSSKKKVAGCKECHTKYSREEKVSV